MTRIRNRGKTAEPIGMKAQLVQDRLYLWPRADPQQTNPGISRTATARHYVMAIWSTKAVLSPPAMSNPWNVIGSGPALVTVNTAVE